MFLWSYGTGEYCNFGNSYFVYFNGLNAWQHIVVSRISGSVAVYVNGVLKTTYSLPGSLIAQQYSRIGDFYGSNGYYSFSGNIAVAKIYNGKGLTSSEAGNHYNLIKSRFGL